MSFKDDWCEVKVKDIAKIKGGKRLPKGTSLIKEENSHPYIRVRDLGLKNITLNNDFEYVDDKTYQKISRYIVNTNDIVISIVGTIGLVSKIDKSLDNANLTENCVKLIDLKGVNSDYLYYFLISDKGKYEISTGTVGAVQAKLPIKNIQNINIPLPSINEQNAIAATLSCLDDKIELNNRINKNLEEISQALFKSWFVDFEPFQDGEFEDSELGRIPKGWRVGVIDELIESTIGGDWGKDSEQGNYTEEVVCMRGADIPEIAKGKRGKPPVRFIIKKNLEKKQLFKDQITIEISGGSPTQSTGRTALITDELLQVYKNPLICTNFCRALSFKKKEFSTFVYSLMQYLYKKDIFFLYENGTTGIKNLDTGNLFGKHQIIIPDEITLKEYYELFHTLLKSIYDNGFQADKLSEIRDTLLPKLMTGEIRVPIEEVK